MTFPKIKIFLISILISLLSLAPVLAEPMDPTGLWAVDDGESRYEITLCGDGTQLCAKLVWIRPDVISDRNKVYLNTYVINKAKRKTDREWRGGAVIYGFPIAGSVRAHSKDRMTLRGCALLVICFTKRLSKMATSN